MVVKLVSKNFEIPEAYTLSVARENGRYASLEKPFSMRVSSPLLVHPYCLHE
jgi:NADH-quinone oxidoreductase subunit F